MCMLYFLVPLQQKPILTATRPWPKSAHSKSPSHIVRGDSSHAFTKGERGLVYLWVILELVDINKKKKGGR